MREPASVVALSVPLPARVLPLRRSAGVDPTYGSRSGPLSVHSPGLSAKSHEPGPELVEGIMRTAMMLREQLHHPARKLRPSALFANSRELIEDGFVED